MAINAQEMIDNLECFLKSNAGVSSINVDGQSIRYNREQALKELRYWQTQEKIQQGKRKRSGRIKLNNTLD